jgi:hypothetical protein
MIHEHHANSFIGYHQIGSNGLLACYVIAQFFFNFGPNSTTFIVPGECKSTISIPPHLTRKTETDQNSQASQLVTVLPLTVSPPLPARSAPSSPKSSSALSVRVVPPPRTRALGSTMSCKYTPSSCCWAASPPSSSPRPSARLSSNLPARSLVLLSLILDSRAT